MTKYLIIIILFFISSIIFLYIRSKKGHIRELMKDSRTGTFVDKK